MNLLLPFLFILSRIFFINTKGVFFDSLEYKDLFSYPSYPKAIISGHFPPHEGYIIIFWPLFHLANFLHLDPAYLVILGQILLAVFTTYCFYKIISFISDKHTALLASIIVSLIPLFWITNVTIMMEIAYVSSFFFSVYFLIRYIKMNYIVFLHVSAFLFSFGFITHAFIILWFPLYIAIVYYKKKKKLLTIFLTVILYLSGIVVCNLLFTSAFSTMGIFSVFKNFYLSKGDEFAVLPLDITGLLIALRNFLIPLLHNNTSLLVITSFISLVLLFRRNKQLFVLGLLWILPAAFANQWWDSLLNGRHALIASFGLAFVTAYLIKNNRIVTSLVIVYLLFVSLPIMNLLNKPIPYLEEAKVVKTLPKDSLLIETHFAKPQVEKTFTGEFLAVNDPLTSKKMIQKEINIFLQKKKPIFISSGALSEPYGLYSGPYLHNITLSYAKPFEMHSVITHYSFILYKTINVSDNLLLYKIISSKPSPYPYVMELQSSSRRLDYYDPIARLLWIHK